MASHDVPIGTANITLAALNERSREIFRQIVESYLATGEPVGSRNLSRLLPITLSPASVRNVMSDLEQLGLIFAPHTSAGRLPTEIGLRFFVDALMQVGDLSESAIKRRFRVKDSGDIIPGHGGLMDRLDSTTFGVLFLFAVGTLHGGASVAAGFLNW